MVLASQDLGTGVEVNGHLGAIGEEAGRINVGLGDIERSNVGHSDWNILSTGELVHGSKLLIKLM